MSFDDMEMPKMNKGIVIIVLAIFILLILMFTFRIKNVKPQQVGIVTNKVTHKVLERPIYQGWVFWCSLLKDIEIYWKSTKRFPADEKKSYRLPFKSKDGQKIIADLSIQYSLVSVDVYKLHKEIGPDFLEQVLMPQIRSQSRIVLGMYTAEELYDGTIREKIQEKIGQKLTMTLKKFPAITIEDALLREFEFDPAYQKLIEDKKKAEQQIAVNKNMARAEYENALKKEAIAKGEKLKEIQEATAKAESLKINANGIAKKKRIEASADRFAKEQNAKGNLAILMAEAKGKRALTQALGGGQFVVGLEMAAKIGPSLQTFGIPMTKDSMNLMNLPGLNFGFDKASLMPSAVK